MRGQSLVRGERILPGLWRLRLPMPGLTVPHCNAWAIAAGGDIVLVDCGMRARGSLHNLEQALAQCGLRIEHVRVWLCTHAHIDHCGQAGAVLERARCELWMHPAHGHLIEMREDRERAVLERLEIGRSGGVPDQVLESWLQTRAGELRGIDRWPIPHRPLVVGVELQTDVGPWQVVETPGHAPSHVCLFQPERRLLISGDHLMGKVSLYFDYGYSPDPAGEFLRLLNRVEALDARLGLSGHGRTFVDVAGRIAANRELVGDQLRAVTGCLQDGEPLSAFEVVRTLYDGPLSPLNVTWWMNTTLCYLTHLEVQERVRRIPGSPDRWVAGRRPRVPKR